MFVQATKSRKNGKTYTSHLVRESFRTPNGRQFRITLVSDSQPRPTAKEFEFHPVPSTVLLRPAGNFRFDPLHLWLHSPSRQSRVLPLLLIALLNPTTKCRVVDANHGGKPCRTHARTIEGREYFLPLAKRRAHSPQTVLLEDFPC